MVSPIPYWGLSKPGDLRYHQCSSSMGPSQETLRQWLYVDCHAEGQGLVWWPGCRDGDSHQTAEIHPSLALPQGQGTGRSLPGKKLSLVLQRPLEQTRKWRTESFIKKCQKQTRANWSQALQVFLLRGSSSPQVMMDGVNMSPLGQEIKVTVYLKQNQYMNARCSAF